MKYTNEIEINLPIQKVIKLIDDPESLKHCHPGLIIYELFGNQLGEVAS